MKAADVMATNVISVGSEASVQEVAEVLLRNRVSGVPVTGSQGELIGIVSEGDLMRRPEAGTQRRHSWWLHLVASKEGLASEYIKSHSRKVVDVMSRNVVTASPETPVGDVAELLERHAIKRVPIVKDGKVVGIVSRANLLQALASLKNMPAGKTDDASIRAKLMAKLANERWTTPSLLNLIVHDGTVDLWGIVQSQTEKKAVRVLVESTAGVRAVNDNLIIPSTMSGLY
jgi:CBS-domain-containing membrane protein